MAILLNSKFKGRGLVRTIFFLPILLGSGAVLETLELATQNIQGGAAAMSTEMAPVAGVNVDYFLSILLEVGLPVRLLDFIVGLVGGIYEIVRASSVQIIIFIAALQSVSPSLYEVSKIEGATPYETFWKVTFPMVSPLILTNVVYTIVDKFVNSQVVDIAYSTAFTNYNYGLSSAMSVISTVIVCLILLIVGGLITKITFYYN
jgi:ABC-type sugar transport system permease subunit